MSIAGRVMLRLLVDSSGTVSDVQVVRSPHEGLARAAAVAARNWQYGARPARTHRAARCGSPRRSTSD